VSRCTADILGLDAAAFREVDERLGQLAEDAGELARAAQGEAFVELGNLAESLRLQLLSVRHRFRLFRRRRGAAGEP
jgi:hypothetical protein